MLKQKTVLEVKCGERVYQFHCDPESQLGELYDVLNQMVSYVVSRMQTQPKPVEPVEPEACCEKVEV